MFNNIKNSKIMGVEVKSGGEGVIVADRGCNDGCCCNGRNSGWGSGWGAVGGALVGGGFGAAAVSVWDKINDTKADIQKVESTVQEAKAGIYKDISDAARGVTQEIARLNRVVDAQRDQNIIQSVVAALKTTSTTPAQ